MGATLGLIISPSAGNGKGATAGHEVARRLHAAGYHTVPLSAPTSAEVSSLIARAIRDRIVDGLITVGGDGTIHLAIQHLVGTDLFLGHIPFGTGNDIARDLGLTIKWETGLEHLMSVIDQEPASLDVMEITGSHGTTYGLAIVSVGVDAVVNQQANRYTRPHGHARYLRAIAAKVPRYKPRTYTITVNGQTNTAPAIIAAVANLRSFGGGLTLSPGSDATDGILELLVAKPLTLREFVSVFPKIYSGRHMEADFVHLWRTTEVEIAATGEPIVAMVDGEEIGPLPVKVRVRRRGLRFLR